MTSSNASAQTDSALEERLHMASLGAFKTSSLVLGSLVGLFIYLSTLGAEFVGVMLWGKEILDKSNNELIVFSLTWNLVTTIVAIVVLTSLRRLVSIVFRSAVSPSRQNSEDVLSELLSYMEGRFAVGALVGICLSWNLTNFILGMRPQVIQSCIILAVACFWCRVTLILIGQPEYTLIYDSADEEEAASSQKPQKSLADNDISEPLLAQV